MTDAFKTACLTALSLLTATAACNREQPHVEGPKLGWSDPIPTAVSPGTKLRIGDPKIQKQLELSGLIKQVPFAVQWQNITGGPQTIEAFRAGALDAGSVGDTPPIHAKFTGLDVKIVAVHFRDTPSFRFAIAPGAKVDSLADFRGKRIAYAPGQAQGALLLRVLEKQGIATEQVRLVELTSSEFKDALSSRQVDVAPLSGPILRRYLKERRTEGAHAISHGTRDTLSFLYVRSSVLEDPAKAAALHAYVQLRARAQVWASDHSEAWLKHYYIDDQSLSEEDARAVIDVDVAPRHPEDWREAIAFTQATINLIARASGRAAFPAEQLFDLRFQTASAQAARTARAASPGAGSLYAGAD